MKKLLSILFATLILLSCFAAAFSAFGASTFKITGTYGQTEARSMLQMVNSFRTGSEAWYWNSDNSTKTYCSGLSKYVYDYDLEAAAMQRAAEIAISFAHTRPSGEQWYSLLNNKGRYTMGENIAAGYTSAESVYMGWREDYDDYAGQGHRRNMLSSSFTAIGIGHFIYNGRHYWVQEFGAPAVDTNAKAANNSKAVVPVEVSASIAASHTSHSYDSGKITTAPTCGSTGIKTYTCTYCGAKKTETIPKDTRSHVDADKNGKCDKCGTKMCVITSQPVSVTQTVGTTAKFTVKATGVSMKYQWRVSGDGGKTWTNTKMTGYNTATLSVPVKKDKNGYIFKCVIKDTNNTVYSNSVTLKVKGKITAQPQNITRNIGSTVAFHVEYSGVNPTYQWQYSWNGGSKWQNSGLTGCKTPTLSVEVIAGRNDYMYRCVIKDKNNTVTSNAATLKAKVVITTQPKNITQKAGTTAKFIVKAAGVKPSYQWQVSTDFGSTWKNSGMTGNKTATLSIPAILDRNGQMYRCVISDVNNKVISNAVKLTVKK